jgi:hypothetical protein
MTVRRKNRLQLDRARLTPPTGLTEALQGMDSSYGAARGDDLTTGLIAGRLLRRQPRVRNAFAASGGTTSLLTTADRGYSMRTLYA